MTGTKADIRQRMRERRKALTPKERESASEVVCAKLSALGCKSPIAVYLASPQEIDLSPFVRKMLAAGAQVVAPRWNGETYELAAVKGLGGGDLRKGPMGILEPSAAELVSPDAVGTWLVPGLAFTRDGRRLGYGGGWYDRLLANAAKAALKYGIAHAFQVVGELPSEPHDIPLTAVVDDSKDLI